MLVLFERRSHSGRKYMYHLLCDIVLIKHQRETLRIWLCGAFAENALPVPKKSLKSEESGSMVKLNSNLLDQQLAAEAPLAEAGIPVGIHGRSSFCQN